MCDEVDIGFVDVYVEGDGGVYYDVVFVQEVVLVGGVYFGGQVGVVRQCVYIFVVQEFGGFFDFLL